MLSVVVIAKDEADRLGRCLASVAFAEERIVVLDPTTTDATAQVARAHGARVIVEPFRGHVGQKNFALGQARCPWVLSLDGDEWLTARAARDLRRATIVAEDRVVGLRFPRCSVWLGRPMRHGRWYPDRKIRVVRHGRGRWVGDDPHDRLEVDGAISDVDHDLMHEPYRTIWEHLSTIDRYTDIAADTLARRGVRARPWDPVAHASLHFVDAMLLKHAWRDGADGVAVATLGAIYSGLKWSRLRAISP